MFLTTYLNSLVEFDLGQVVRFVGVRGAFEKPVLGVATVAVGEGDRRAKLPAHAHSCDLQLERTGCMKSSFTRRRRHS